MNYREEVLRTSSQVVTTASVFAGRKQALAMGSMGLAGETGEVVDLLKKHVFHGHALDREKLLKELGDVRWYLEYLLIEADSTIEEIELLNVTKLRQRYPEGFSAEKSQNRIDQPSV